MVEGLQAKPTYRAYVLVGDDSLLDVGAAFAHLDGNGLDVIIQVPPIDGKIVLRAISDRFDHHLKRVPAPDGPTS